MSSIADLFKKYSCTNCQEDISGIRIHCAICENFDLCLPCFSYGAEIGTHRNDHDFQFMDTGTSILSVYRGKGAWTAREEVRLLDAIEKYGFGNWEDISKYIETKSPEDAKEEYINKFVNGTIGRHTWGPAQLQQPTLIDHTAEDKGPLGETAMQHLPPLDVTDEEAEQLGYTPNRDSFEREYDPTAEQLISTMYINADDTEADVVLKLAHVDMYTRRLRDRVRRKRIVRDYQLVANFFRNRNYALHPGLTREQKEFRDRFRVFAQFHTANEFDRLVASLEREKEMRIRLAELCRYRYNGLTKIDECRHFEQHAAVAAGRSTGPYGHGKTDNTCLITGNHQQPDCSSHSQQHSSKKAETSNGDVASSSSIAPKSMHRTADPIYSGASSHSKSSLDSCRGSSGHMTMPTATTTSGTTMVTATTAKLTSNKNHLQTQPPPLHHLQLAKNPSPNQQPSNELANDNQHDVKPQLNPDEQNKDNSSSEKSSFLRAQLDELAHLPQPLGVQMLTNNEQKLCDYLGLLPSTYMAMKTVMLSGAAVPTRLTSVESALRKYFIKVGWLQCGF